MSLISIAANSGKGEKLSINLDAELASELALYRQYNASLYGVEVSAAKVAKLMLEKLLDMDKDFANWKRKRSSPRSHVEAANGAQAPE